MTPLPEASWRELSTDFYGPLPTGEYLLIIIDEFSRYPVVEIIRSTSANMVIPVFDKVMSMFGIHEVLKSDNGPPFNSEQLHSFTTHMGFKHCKVTPYWPRANSEAERFMGNLGKVVKAASSDGKTWKQELNKFIRNYRATAHTITNMSPFAALFGRELKMKLPALSRPNVSDLISDADDIAIARMKLYADNRCQPCKFVKGDAVLVRQPKLNKLTPTYNPGPYRITHKKGSMITASRPGNAVMLFVSSQENAQSNCRQGLYA